MLPLWSGWNGVDLFGYWICSDRCGMMSTASQSLSHENVGEINEMGCFVLLLWPGVWSKCPFPALKSCWRVDLVPQHPLSLSAASSSISSSTEPISEGQGGLDCFIRRLSLWLGAGQHGDLNPEIAQSRVFLTLHYIPVQYSAEWSRGNNSLHSLLSIYKDWFHGWLLM